MSNFQIHELTEKAINRNSNIIHDTLDGGSYATGKNLAGAVADLASANVASPYDDTVTYAIGQYCLYEGDIYRCIAITTGAFDSTKWTQIVVTGEFRRVVELTSAQYTALSSAEKNNGTLYIITDEETTAADIPYSQGVSVADKLDSINGLFKIQQFTHTYSCNANATVNFDNSFITVPSGYTLASVLEFTSGQGSMAIVSVRPNNNGSWAFELKNTSGSTFTNQTFTISLLFVKSEYVS